jgi:predicted negative regulator of RcsB-dependent stress response
MSVQETPYAKKRDWREKGDALLAKGKYNDAIRAYDKAIVTIQPPNQNPFFLPNLHGS